MEIKRNAKFILVMTAAITFFAFFPALSQEQPADNMHVFLEKILADRKLLVAANAEPMAKKAENLWSVYDNYQDEIFLQSAHTTQVNKNYPESINPPNLGSFGDWRMRTIQEPSFPSNKGADNPSPGTSWFSDTAWSSFLWQIFPSFKEGNFGLVPLRSLDELRQLVEQSQEKTSPIFLDGLGRSNSTTMLAVAELDESAVGGQEVSQSHSRTNVQVEGVDEGDIIKTDGRRIYRIKYNELQVVNLLGYGKMEIALTSSMRSVNDNRNYTYFSDLYLTDKYLVVVGQRYHCFTMKIGGGIIETDAARGILPGRFWYGTPQTLITIYDLDELSYVDEIEINGNLMTTRLIEDNLYVISKQHIYLHDEEIDPRPLFRQGEEIVVPEYSDIKYLPDVKTESFTIITQIKLEDKVTFDYDILLGASSWGQIYVSKNAIYLAANTYTFHPLTGNHKTDGHLLSYLFNADGSVAFGGAGKFEGFPINQFAMDESEGTFRMVTTEGWGDSVKNRLYVFKRKEAAGKRELERIGFLDKGIGKPGETVRSVRFNEALVTIVTFEIIDPLYTIDLSNPTSPLIRAGLEVTGFSTYQHPWGEDCILGIGYETDEEGIIIGLKFALYDVSDWDEPLEVGRPLVLLNERRGWSYSEALHNHKAILVAEELGFIGFAISRSHRTPFCYYYTSDYMIFAIDPEAETPVWIDAAITHIDFFIENEEYYLDLYRHSYDFAVERAVYVGHYLYVVSGEAVSSHDILKDFESVASLRFLSNR